MLKVWSKPNQKPRLGVEVPQGGNALMIPRSAVLVGVAVSAMLLISSTQLLRAQVQGAWTLTGDVTAARELGAQATLNNGDILLAGGTDGTSVLASAEVYSPSSDGWTPTGTMAEAREYFPSVTLPGGKVLVTGGLGSSGSVLTGAELYDPASGTWSSAGALAVGRYYHTATLLKGGQVLVTGGCTVSGCSTFTGESELYDPATNSWSASGSLGTARWSHTATLLGSGQVLVVGGSNGSTLNACELYDPVTGAWTSAPSTTYKRFLHAATLLQDGKVLVTGGNPFRTALAMAEIYDPSANQWTATGRMTQGRFAHTSTLLADGTVLLAAGGTFRGCGRTICFYRTATSEIYDEATGRFTTVSRLNQARYYHTASLMENGRVLVVGGIGGSSTLQGAEFYVPLTLTISPLNLDFGLLEVGLTSGSQTITVTNVSKSPVTFTGMASDGDYAQSANCPAILDPGQSCTVSVTFSPTAGGTRAGSVTLSDNSVGSPDQTIALTGTGEPGDLSFTPSSLTFPPTLPGTSSAPKSATLYNDSAAVVDITVIAISPSNAFSQTNDCSGTLNPGQSCTFQVVFTPHDSDAPYNGTLSVTNNGNGSPQTISLSGT